MTTVKTFAGLAIIVIALASLVGWIKNLGWLFNHMHATIDGEFILRLVGIPIAAIGAVMGYM